MRCEMSSLPCDRGDSAVRRGSGWAHSDELVVLLDDTGRAVGTARKSAVHHRDTPRHLAFSCYIVDASGRLLVTTRAHDKPSFPGLQTNSVCGHPQPGESLELAVQRRAATELGLAVPRPTLVVADFGYVARMGEIAENEACPVFVVAVADDPPLRPDPREVADVEWVAWTSFREQVLSGQRHVSSWCVTQVRLLAALGDDPHRWPAADPAGLPPAARSGAVPSDGSDLVP